MLKREIIKNLMIVSIILLIAVLSTYHIYYKFQNDRDVDVESESLTVVFHDADQLDITKVTPVTDSVGLSSNSYSFDITNNLTVGVPYQVKIVPDTEQIEADGCSEILIPEEDIRISVKVGKSDNKIYNLSDLEDGILLMDEVGALKTENVSVRVWINKDSTLLAGSKMHYHGMIQVIENEDILAIK